MGRSLTQEEFMKRLEDTFKGKGYDFTKAIYTGALNKVTVICPVHGEFQRTANQLQQGRACQVCSRESGNKKRTQTVESFISKAVKKHSDKNGNPLYDYSLVEYKNTHTKVKFKCNECSNVWMASPASHLQGAGCGQCGLKKQGLNRVKDFTEEIMGLKALVSGVKISSLPLPPVKMRDKVTLTCKKHGEFTVSVTQLIRRDKGLICKSCVAQSKFIKDSTDVHGGRFDYSEVNYTRHDEEVKIRCNSCGNFFWQTPKNHKAGYIGCVSCSNKLKKEALTYNTEEVVTQFKSVHGENYDYSQVTYKSAREDVKIWCKKCKAFFLLSPGRHKEGCYCPTCTKQDVSKSRTKTTTQFIKEANKVHDFKYSYIKANYVSSKDKVEIICPKHGSFWQAPECHLYKEHGCPKCSHHVSKPETEIADYVENDLNLKVIRSDRTIIKPKELDIVIPEHKLAIEYNGMYWHSTKFQKNKKHLLEKQQLCKEKGYRLIHVMEYENLEVVKKTISYLTGHAKKVFARKCEVKRVGNVDSFLDENHVQGGVNLKSHNFGLFYEGEMVAVMCFSSASSIRGTKKEDRVWELRRFSSSMQVVGGASKLFKAFLRSHDVKKVVSYSDNRWFDGGMYEKLGFSMVSELPPDYKYVKGDNIYTKGRFTHANMRKMKYFDYNPEETELENTERNGFYRVPDCGKRKWEVNL